MTGPLPVDNAKEAIVVAAINAALGKGELLGVITEHLTQKGVNNVVLSAYADALLPIRLSNYGLQAYDSNRLLEGILSCNQGEIWDVSAERDKTPTPTPTPTASNTPTSGPAFFVYDPPRAPVDYPNRLAVPGVLFSRRRTRNLTVDAQHPQGELTLLTLKGVVPVIRTPAGFL